ncbi:MAG: carbohydrate kinase family protein [Thermoplasmata archaeon]
MKSFVGVFGHTAIDVILEVPSLPEPNTSIGLDKKTIRYGGTGANIARCASELDVSVSLASFVGDDFPEDYREALIDSNVQIYDLKEIEGHNTTKVWIITDVEENQMAVVDQGAMKYSSKFDLQKETIKNSDIIHIGTGRPEYYERVIKLANELNKKIYFDPAQELKYVYNSDNLPKIIKNSDLFFCNETELSIALEYLKLNDPMELFDHLETFIVTKGNEGSILYHGDKKTIIPAFKPDKLKEPTGAGDAYRAGFYAALNRGFDIVESCKIASARASFTVESAGPQENLIDWKTLIERYRSNNTM